MSIQSQTYLVSSLLPKSIMSRLQTEEKEEKLGESAICAVALLVINTVLGAVRAIKLLQYKAFDANPGDGGCQCRALELRRIFKMDLKDEMQALEKTALIIKDLLNKRKGAPKVREKCSPEQFFKSQLGSIAVSKEMEYLLHCYLSKVLRAPYQTLQNGVVLTKSDMSKLSVLSEKITLLDTVTRRKIVEENQKVLSFLSVEAMREAAEQIYILPKEEKELMITMLSKENTHIFSPSVQYEPKAFGCLFYEIKTMLSRLLEEKELVCLTSIEVASKPFHLLLQPDEKGKEFIVLPDEACTVLSPSLSVIVFEAVFHVEKENAVYAIRQFGFSEIILMLAAKEAPYEPSSDLEDVKVPAAAQEINLYRKKEIEMKSIFTLDHICLNTLGDELKR